MRHETFGPASGMSWDPVTAAASSIIKDGYI